MGISKSIIISSAISSGLCCLALSTMGQTISAPNFNHMDEVSDFLVTHTLHNPEGGLIHVQIDSRGSRDKKPLIDPIGNRYPMPDDKTHLNRLRGQ